MIKIPKIRKYWNCLSIRYSALFAILSIFILPFDMNHIFYCSDSRKFGRFTLARSLIFKFELGEGTLPWTIFHFRIFSNYFWQKFEKAKKTVWKSVNLTMYGNFFSIYINIITYKKHFQKNLTFGPRQGPWPLPWAIHLNL